MNISLATIPPRIKNGSLEKCINAFNKQTITIKNIFINLPTHFERFEDLTEDDINYIKSLSPKIKITKTPYDSPALKFLGCLKYLEEDDIIFIGDDDQEYHSELLEKMKEGMYNDNAVYQNRYHIVKTGTAGIIHGFVGLMMKKKVFNNIDNFTFPKKCWIDDQLFSIYFFINKIKILPSPINDFDEIFSNTSDYGTEQIGDGALCMMDIPRIKQIKELERMYGVFFLKKRNKLSKGALKYVDYNKLTFPNIHLVLLDKPTKQNKLNMKILIKKYPHFNFNLWDLEEFKKDHPEIELKTISQLNYWCNKYGLEKIKEDSEDAIYINRNLSILPQFDLWTYILDDDHIFRNEEEILLIKKSYKYSI